MRWCTTARLLTFLVVLTAGSDALALPPQRLQEPKPVEPAELPADWGERDLEGRWVAYRAATGDADGDARTKKAWVLAIAASGDAALLEWITIYEGWRHAGPQLARLDPPGLLRAAAWNLGALDSHNKDNAEQALRARGGVALGWLLAHPLAQRGKAAAMFRQLRDEHEPDAAGAERYLPPHEPMQVLVPWLDAPDELLEFGDRPTAEPRTRYVHQVVRALDGVVVFGQADATIVAKVVRLCRHGNGTVATAAFSTLSKLPGERVPHAGLLGIVEDPGVGLQRRQLAARTLAVASHPEAFLALHEIAGSRGHPVRGAALAALGDIGDATTVAMLSGFVVESDAELLAAQRLALQRIQERRKSAEILQPNELRVLLLRVAWLRQRGDPRAASHATAAAHLLSATNRPDAVAAALEVVEQLPLIDVVFAAAEVEPVRAEFERFIAELRR